MYVEQCVRTLYERKKNYRAFQRLTEPHKHIVNAVVEYLEKVQRDADYERHNALKESFAHSEVEDDEDYDYEDYSRAMRGELVKPQTSDQPSTDKTESSSDALEDDPELTLELYSKLRVSLEDGQAGGANTEVSSWLSRLLRSASHNKPFKVCDEHEVEQLQALRSCFPNLIAVVDQIIGAATLSARFNAPFELPAMLIDGPPGVGKTYLIHKVADLLGVPVININMASLSGRFELAGGHRSYKDAEPSILFKALYDCEFANPLVLLDEAECGDANLYQPLYHIVEDRFFRDHFLNVEFRVDGANYVFITNDKELLAPALRSRLNEFDVVSPKPYEMAQIVRRLFDDVCESCDLFEGYVGSLNSACLQELLSASLRDAKGRIKSALLASAAAGSKNEMLLTELKKTRPSGAQSGMGFLK